MTPHERLERSTWDLFWLPPEARVLDRPDVLAIGIDRDIAYLNTVYRTRASPAELPALVREVTSFHGAYPSRWCAIDTVDTTALVETLLAAGYEPSAVHDARLLAVESFVGRPSAASIEVRRVACRQTLADCWHVMDAAFGKGQQRTEDDADLELSQCGPADARIQRYVAYLDGEPVCSGGINVYPALGFGLLWAGGTVPHARGRGAYSALVGARVARAAASSIPFVGLYARRETSSPIVAKQGFEPHGTMAYYVRSPSRVSARPR